MRLVWGVPWGPRGAKGGGHYGPRVLPCMTLHRRRQHRRGQSCRPTPGAAGSAWLKQALADAGVERRRERLALHTGWLRGRGASVGPKTHTSGQVVGEEAVAALALTLDLPAPHGRTPVLPPMAADGLTSWTCTCHERGGAPTRKSHSWARQRLAHRDTPEHGMRPMKRGPMKRGPIERGPMKRGVGLLDAAGARPARRPPSTPLSFSAWPAASFALVL